MRYHGLLKEASSVAFAILAWFRTWPPHWTDHFWDFEVHVITGHCAKTVAQHLLMERAVSLRAWIELEALSRMTPGELSSASPRTSSSGDGKLAPPAGIGRRGGGPLNFILPRARSRKRSHSATGRGTTVRSKTLAYQSLVMLAIRFLGRGLSQLFVSGICKAHDRS